MFFFASFMNRFVYLNKWQGRRVPRNVVFGKGPRVYMCARVYVYVCEREAACVRCLASRSSPAKLPGQSRASSTTTVYLQVTLLFIWRLSDWLGFCKGHLVDTDTRPQARASPHVYFVQSFFSFFQNSLKKNALLYEISFDILEFSTVILFA